MLLASAIAVVAYELAACRIQHWELISEAVDRHRARYPRLVHIGVALLAGHLTRRIPPRLDPLTQLTRLARRMASQ